MTFSLPKTARRWTVVRPGRARKIRSLTLVLEGNNPRFPRKSSTTMLTHRLTGTTEAFGV